MLVRYNRFYVLLGPVSRDDRINGVPIEKNTVITSVTLPWHRDQVAEWLRRWTANPLGFPRVSSNLILIESFSFCARPFQFANGNRRHLVFVIITSAEHTKAACNLSGASRV
uniref:Uncharacterized protein n=1 Tax=Steinernema glaseri TaxID=37863 RepID=A0A1I7YKL2_9BILA